jgi:hypothetical protein
LAEASKRAGRLLLRTEVNELKTAAQSVACILHKKATQGMDLTASDQTDQA